MAKVSGILTRLRGTIGDVTFARRGGVTVAKQKLEKKSTPRRTLEQMTIRMKWRNLQNLYSVLRPYLHPAYENRPANLSDYNLFMRYNSSAQPVYLKKDYAQMGGCLVSAVEVTRGSLPSIMLTDAMGGEVSTDIAMGGITIGAATTVKEFSEAIINNNPNFRDGDEITVIIIEQRTDTATGRPFCGVFSEQITLDVSATAVKVRDIVAASGFSVVDGNLGTSSAVDGGVVYIHSRKEDGKTLVSEQMIKVTNSQLSQYTTEAALKAAIDSYGGLNGEQYLTPGYQA